MTEKVKKTTKVQRIGSLVEGSSQSGNIWTEYWLKLEGITELFRVQTNHHPSIALTREGDTVTVNYLPDSNRSTVFLHEYHAFKNDTLASLDHPAQTPNDKPCAASTSRTYEHLGAVELPPLEDAEFTRQIEQAEADIAQRKTQQ